VTFAQRALSFTRFNLGGANDVEEFELAWGGPYYLRGYSPDSYGPAECAASRNESEYDLFCPAQRQVIGSSTLLLNTELRVPLLNPIKDDWLPLNFPPLELAFFFDVGVAFTPGLNTLVWKREPGQDIVVYREPLTSYGASLRMNLFYAILRIDYTVPRSRGAAFDRGMWTVAFGEMF
jgi:outer membrane protein assembly factor BamA